MWIVRVSKVSDQKVLYVFSVQKMISNILLVSRSRVDLLKARVSLELGRNCSLYSNCLGGILYFYIHPALTAAYW